jgi:hypothetical protein
MTVYNRYIKNKSLQIKSKRSTDNSFYNELNYVQSDPININLLHYIPDRNNFITENIVYNTDIIESFSGSEQRIPILQEPRNTLTYTYTLKDKELQKFNIFLQKNQSKDFYIPVWSESKLLLKDTVALENFIELDTTASRFQENLYFIIMSSKNKDDYKVYKYYSENKEENKVFIGESFNDLKLWEKGDIVIPVILVKMIEEVQKVFPSATDRIAGFKCKFQKIIGEDKVVVDNSISYPIYKDLYIIDKQPNKRFAMTQRWQRKILELDYGYGKTYTYDRADNSFTLYNFNWTLSNLNDIINLKTFFNNVKGRLKSFWYSSNENEITSVFKSYNSIDSVLTVENIGLNTYYNNKDFNIKINFKNGGYIIKNVISINELNDNEEELILEENFKIGFSSEDIDSINILYLCRFNNDQFTFVFINNEVCEVRKNILVEKIGEI